MRLGVEIAVNLLVIGVTLFHLLFGLQTIFPAMNRPVIAADLFMLWAIIVGTWVNAKASD